MTGLGFVCACGHPDAPGAHARGGCSWPVRPAAADEHRLAEFKARLDHVASGLESALEKVDRSNVALQAMLRDVKAWSDSIGGRP